MSAFVFIEDEDEVDEEQHCECYECDECDEHEYIIYCDECEPEEPEIEVLGSPVTFEDEVPDRRTLADPEVKAKAAQSRSKRSRSTKNKDYAGKRADGWSYCCAHKDHLPNLCEKEQAVNGITCTCPCHEERGFNLDDAIRRYEDEEVIDLFD